MAKRLPVQRAHQLADLNSDEVVEGYRWGFRGEAEPGENCSFSHWHGWRNGMADSGRAIPDHAQRALAHSYVEQANG